MRRRAFAVVVLCALYAMCAGLAPARADSPEETFDRGNEAYAEGDYAAAAEAYESVLRYRIRDPRVEFNLGNAEFRRGNLGKAILHYERARRLDPTDEDTLANLEYARSFAYDQVPTEEPAAVVRWVVETQNALGPDRQAWIVLMLFWALAGVMGWSLGRPSRFRPAYGWVLAALLLAIAVGVTSWYVTWQRLEGTPLAVVLGDAVEVLAGPGQNNATLFTIHEGLTVEVRGDARSEWIQVSLPNGLTGWVPLESVGLV